MTETRRPLIAVVGHVDHGKTTLLDTIRQTTVTSREAGLITQAIGASIVPINVIKEVCKELIEQQGIQFSIPGLLFIDTPGHAAFSSLRKRGGNIADIAIVVVDVNEGFMPQTEESIEILKMSKTPFVVAANKIDLLPGWQESSGSVMKQIKDQPPQVQKQLDERMYELVGKLHEHGFQSERFDRVEDRTKQVSIVPSSAKHGIGLPELLLLLAGMSQRYFEDNLQTEREAPGRATILEVTEEKGLGTTLDVILYDGCIKVNDQIVIGDVVEPIVTKVRALLEPQALVEMSDRKSDFMRMDKVHAATGVKIVAPNTDQAMAGMPVRVARDNVSEVKEQIQEEVDEVTIDTDDEGIIIRADTLGSLEAMITLMKESHIPIRHAQVGPISKKDVIEAVAAKKQDPLYGAVLGFNVKALPEAGHLAEDSDVEIITRDIIYKVIEDFQAWQEQRAKELEGAQFDELTKPGRARILPGYIFRQSNPAVVGVEVVQGTFKPGVRVVAKDGSDVGFLKTIQLENETIGEAKPGDKVAVSLEGATVGRQIEEGDTIDVAVPEEDFRALKEHKDRLSEEQKVLLRHLAKQRRQHRPRWGF